MSNDEGSSGGQDSPHEEELVEPKAKPKIIRVLTVIAYTLSVSMAAILLSIYYVFMWDGHPTLAHKSLPMEQGPTTGSRLPEEIAIHGAIRNSTEYLEGNEGSTTDVEYNSTEGSSTRTDYVADIPFEPTAIPVLDAATTSPALPAMVLTNNLDTFVREDRNDSMPPGNFSEVYALSKRSPLLQKLVFKNLAD